jgi:hypothetical protein
MGRGWVGWLRTVRSTTDLLNANRVVRAPRCAAWCILVVAALVVTEPASANPLTPAGVRYVKPGEAPPNNEAWTQ